MATREELELQYLGRLIKAAGGLRGTDSHDFKAALAGMFADLDARKADREPETQTREETGDGYVGTELAKVPSFSVPLCPTDNTRAIWQSDAIAAARLDQAAARERDRRRIAELEDGLCEVAHALGACEPTGNDPCASSCHPKPILEIVVRAKVCVQEARDLARLREIAKVQGSDGCGTIQGQDAVDWRALLHLDGKGGAL